MIPASFGVPLSSSECPVVKTPHWPALTQVSSHLLLPTDQSQWPFQPWASVLRGKVFLYQMSVCMAALSLLQICAEIFPETSCSEGSLRAPALNLDEQCLSECVPSPQPRFFWLSMSEVRTEGRVKGNLGWAFCGQTTSSSVCQKAGSTF